MTKTYGATNPDQLAALFDMRAEICKRAAVNQTAKIHATKFLTEAATWIEAADIIRNTEFVGWTSGRFIPEIKD